MPDTATLVTLCGRDESWQRILAVGTGLPHVSSCWRVTGKFQAQLGQEATTPNRLREWETPLFVPVLYLIII